MRILVVILMLVSPAAFGLTDVPYTFDPTKITAADDSFHFLRSFVDYYYLVYAANKKELPTLASLEDQGGWCVGDAHPENFGALLLEDDSSVFTVNDIDDAGPCPVILDLARLMTASRLYNPSISIKDIFAAYSKGLVQSPFPTPQPVQDLLDKSKKDGEDPPNSKVHKNLLVRDKDGAEIPPQIAGIIQDDIMNLLPHHSHLIDEYETSKVGGGSGGLRRYEILVKDKKNLVDLELKQEVTPSIYPVAIGQIPDLADRLKTTLLMEQGSGYSTYDSSFTIDGLNMILRPRFSGNQGVNLGKNSTDDDTNIILFEAYVLGGIHARSVKNWGPRLNSVDLAALEKDIDALSAHFTQKWSELKP